MFRRLFAPLAALFLLGACATGTPVDPADMSRSLVYGYIDIEEAPAPLDWIYIMRYDGSESGYNPHINDGMFYHLGVVPGPYQIDSFGGFSFLRNAHYTFNFGGSGRNGSATRIDGPGAYFLGSHRYVDVDTGWFEEAKFEIEPARNGPSEREILTWVLRHLESENSEYTHQIGMVRRRLAELG